MELCGLSRSRVGENVFYRTTGFLRALHGGFARVLCFVSDNCGALFGFLPGLLAYVFCLLAAFLVASAVASPASSALSAAISAPFTFYFALSFHRTGLPASVFVSISSVSFINLLLSLYRSRLLWLPFLLPLQLPRRRLRFCQRLSRHPFLYLS